MKGYSDIEIQAIESAHDELKRVLASGMTPEQMEYIDKAYVLAFTKYDNRRMLNGKPYILHLIEMAKIVYLEFGMRSKCVVSAFLHGITYKTGLSISFIREQFGESVAKIIDGFDKISFVHTDAVSFNAEQYRRLFISLIDDIRVILLKITHRIYDFRHKDEISPEKMQGFINEMKYIFIPIVHRLGLYSIKKEMEEEVMKFENPAEFEYLQKKIETIKEQQYIRIEDFLKPIQDALKEEDINTSIKWRFKSIPSIFAKMQRQNVPFEEVYDILAVRIIIKGSPEENEKTDCWRVYSLITNIYQPNNSRLRDWITTPKPSGYESLHTTVLYGKAWVEVQIRTERMDYNAETGSASHWRYKDISTVNPEDEWLNKIRLYLESPIESQIDFPDEKLSKTHEADKVYILTPTGELRKLRIGSTVLDFAYDIHTEIGNHCSGAIVNGKERPLFFVLTNGDVVEIKKDDNVEPKTKWLSFVTTEKAKNMIRKFLREEKHISL